MKRFLICLLAVIMLFNMTIPKMTVSADGLTLAAISAAAYAIASASGMTFTIGAGGSSQVWMENSISTWMGGRSIAEVFGTELIRLQAGKLIIPSMVVNAINDFLSEFISDNAIPENDSNGVIVAYGQFNDSNVYPYINNGSGNARGRYAWGIFRNEISTVLNGGWQCVLQEGNHPWKAYYNNTKIGLDGGNVTYPATSGNSYRWGFTALNGELYMSLARSKEESTTGFVGSVALTGYSYTGGTTNAKIPGTYDYMDDLNDIDIYEGTIQDAADTNLDDLIDDIFEKVDEGDLTVSGEVVEEGAIDPPLPTTAPGSTTLDDIGDLVGDVAGTLEGVEEAVGEIAQDVADVADGIGDITDALDVPAANDFRVPSLNTLFPFCIPFDLYNIVMAFNVPAEAPHVQIPFNIPALGLSYTFDLDFSQFNGVASTVRTMEFVAFAVGLAILSSKVIRW